jgi:sarcosine oxidase
VRIVIVGGGIVGLLTAVDRVTSGHDVALVEQAGIPHTGAASFDRHRVLRALHPADPAATAAAVRAHHRWIGLERCLSATFYHRVGALTVLPPDRLEAACATLAAAGSRAAALGPDEVASAYPQVATPAGAAAVLEFEAGVLLADQVLAACARWLRRQPNARLHPHRLAVSVDPDGPSVRLADGSVLGADALLLAAGPWSGALLPPEVAGKLTLYRQSMIYCKVPAAAAAEWQTTPPMLSLGADGGAWLVPPVAGTPLKLSASSACRVVAEVRDHATPPRWRDHLVGAFAAVIPGFTAAWLTGARDCYYLADARTGGPMLAALGTSVLSFAACGGSSFKFAPLIAEALAHRLTGVGPAPAGLYPIDGGAGLVPGVSAQPAVS